jgi:V8-like Glu-specific endopeptidase
MERKTVRCILAATAVALLTAAVTAAPASAQGRIKVGDEFEYSAATTAYPRGEKDRPVVWSETVVSPGATFVRVHFSKFNLPDGDSVTVSSPNGEEYWTYTAKGPHGTGEFWAFTVDGDTASVELRAGDRMLKGPARRSYGLAIDRIAHGTAPMDEAGGALEKVVCGTDGRQNAACHPGINMNPVARLSYQSGGSSYVCTGWLVAGSNSNTMVTNQHCVDNQTEVSTVQARFNYQTTTCGGSTSATTTTYAGGTFLRTSAALDYTLFTLQGNPEATWGEYTATTKLPTVGMNINFPQHPGGGLKRIAYWKDSAQTLRCNVSTVNATYGSSTSGSQVGYSCDSAGGSSGSPVLDAGTGRVIGLHHYGGVGGSSCLNSATQMRQVCSHAGTLLSCASN